jgi:hypothetical protein
VLTRITLLPGSTIGYGRGTDDSGAEITFVGDWRPLADLYEALRDGHHIEVDIASHQVIAWRRLRRSRCGWTGSAASGASTHSARSGWPTRSSGRR